MQIQLNTTPMPAGQIRAAFGQQPKKAAPQRPSTSILTLANHLHSQLSAEWVIEQFYRESQGKLGFTGLIYQYPDEKTGFSHGVMGGHNCSYELTINQQLLGNMDFYSGQQLKESQLAEIERYLWALIHPLRNALQYREAQMSAYRDRLTGAKNRAAFDSDLATEIELAQRHGHPLSLIVMDIDHFKKINDSQGHSFGDQVLRSVSKIAHETIRTSDQFYRYGGEEFVVLAAHGALDGTRLLADRIRSNICQEAYQGIAGLNLSASFGVAQLRDGEGGAELFQRADQALYSAKRNGRNQVVA